MKRASEYISQKEKENCIFIWRKKKDCIKKEKDKLKNIFKKVKIVLKRL